MLPIATVQGVKNGISTGMIIDLSDYLKKTEGVTKDEFTSLENTVSGKLDTGLLQLAKTLQNVIRNRISEEFTKNCIYATSELRQ